MDYGLSSQQTTKYQNKKPYLIPHNPKHRRVDCVSIHSSNTIVKFAEDTTVVRFITDNDKNHDRQEVQHVT